MQELGQYVLSLTIIAIICGILLSLFKDGSERSLIRIVCGIVITITAISPLSDIEISNFFLTSPSYYSEGKKIAAQGEEMAEVEKRQCIQRYLEAYILDKANAMNAEINVTVMMGSHDLPVEVKLSGKCSDRVRQAISSIITNDLGIPGEDQKWTEQK